MILSVSNKYFLQVKARAMNDPEVQQIMSDPAMRMILEQMQSDPQAVQVTNFYPSFLNTL